MYVWILSKFKTWFTCCTSWLKSSLALIGSVFKFLSCGIMSLSSSSEASIWIWFRVLKIFFNLKFPSSYICSRCFMELFCWPFCAVFWTLLRDSTSRDRVLVGGFDGFEKHSFVKDCKSRQRLIHWSRLMKQLGIRACIELATMSFAPSENIIRLRFYKSIRKTLKLTFALSLTVTSSLNESLEPK